MDGSRNFRGMVGSLLSRPDEIMLAAGATGELLVARLRMVLAAMLLLLPLVNAMAGGVFTESLTGLDRFKQINADAGHRTGDRVLRHVAALLHEASDHDDWLVRLGGEEFVLVMPLPAGAAWERVEALRRLVAAIPSIWAWPTRSLSA